MNKLNIILNPKYCGFYYRVKPETGLLAPLLYYLTRTFFNPIFTKIRAYETCVLSIFYPIPMYIGHTADRLWPV